MYRERSHKAYIAFRRRFHQSSFVRTLVRTAKIAKNIEARKLRKVRTRKIVFYKADAYIKLVFPKH